MPGFTRRQFVKSAAATAGALAFAPTARVLGANEDIRVGFVGLGGRGSSLLGSFSKLPGVRVAGLCDVDADHLAKRAEQHPDAFAAQDCRALLERDDIDAIVSATPNHWHALLTIWACQAGKHVYIEKPVSHTVYEGVKMTEAARKYDRIVSSGFQNRSDTGLMPFYERLHAGEWGKVLAVRTLCYRDRASIGRVDTPIAPPQSLDYNLWLGPAQDQPIMRPRLHYDWHWVWNTGDGDLGNQGPHETDLARWALNDPLSLPETVECVGGRYAWDDAGNTPNMLLVRMMYNGIPVTSETINVKRPDYKGVRVGVIITCENGEFRGGRGGGKVIDNEGNELASWKGSGEGHYARFIEAVQQGDRSLLTSEVESAAYSAGLAHLSNIAYRVGDTASTDQVAASFGTDDDLIESVERFNQIRSDAGVPTDTAWTLGPKLHFDSEKMHFVGEMAGLANPYVTRLYRDGFAVTDEV